MKTYYVVNGSLSWGFGGFIKKAYTTEDEAKMVVTNLKRKYRNLTDCEIVTVEAKNKKEAEANRPSMFAGSFAGMDNVNP